ncbi:uncharacterized protein N7518_009064 [Penicillium psychrosexuale]|uniref:uncharacterized protein n=1 Tax=Penicillium psychrosexuale TaxID=1002107 RepID=UPI002544EDEE|nr:uncharacterized protein N7518_009064 [Penicillium psychrosexuale]KAI2708927.1 hypothetical protein CBS147354_9018 [Penicillium roqueforti]KAI3112784.1 hypothetical protein CBS147333_3292 [Penicillium roqueforti]KAI3129714.1 hypothetical protein CBS147326_6163 [Penicillium roqueforti]KAI3158541.1 hypothetical protein CBS147317_4629 [Penicillium roqueforti]KAI3194991.1 hypothetical protein CBS147311_8301 [Penicillium roqueforti]
MADMSTPKQSPEYEGESFDDALETVPIQENNNLNVIIPKSTSTRSLTDSPAIGSHMSPELTEKPPSPSESQAEQKSETAEEQIRDGEGLDGQNDKNNKNMGKGQDEGTGTSDENNPDTNHGVNTATDEPTQGDKPEQGSEVTQTEVEKNGEDHDQSPLQKSPLLTSRRLSTSSSLDEVNLMNSKEDESTHKAQRPGDQTEPPPLPPKNDPAPPASAGLMGLSGGLPSVPWAAPPVNKNPPIPQPAHPRKPSGPFAWFTRSSTATNAKDIKSPPSSASRRNTATSVSTLSSNLDHLARDGDDVSSIGSKKPRRNSLKDQFKMLRLREESHAPEVDQTSVQSGQASVSQSGASPPIIPEEGEDGILVASGVVSPSRTVGPGRTGSVADASIPVDWEMWQHLVNNGPKALASSEELNAAIKRGIPQTIRGVIWQILADCHTGDMEDIYRDLVARGTAQDKDGRTINGTESSSSRSSVRSHPSGSGSRSSSAAPSPPNEGETDKLCKEHTSNDADRLKKAKIDAVALQKLEKTIRRDLGARTSYAKYFVSQGSQEGLFGLCKAYALYDPGVGYAQGMNFIAMPLLFNMDEVDAFAMMVKLMNKYSLRDMFIQDMPGLHRSLYQFERLLEDLEPALYCHLRRRGVPPQLYATQWFLTLFAYRFPLQLVLRIYDLIFEEGLETTILKFGVAIMRRNADALLEMKDMSMLTTFLKERLFDAYIDKQPSTSSILESGFFGSSGASDKEIYRSDIMVQDACAIPLTSEMLTTYTAEWEEKTKTEKEREVELEHLRHTVITQGARVRLLEERAEASDKEHVQLASELVHVKVENEELRDLKDALELQVGQLKNVVDKQPAEVEEKLRAEMERIMKRNIEVQNENRAMEESMSDMEKELVATKMKWAEISENHENLRQKWSDLRRALD